MKIGNHSIPPVFVVAELSGNAGKDFDKALALVHAAHRAGADAVKTQCFTPDSITLDSDRPEFRLTWNGQERTLYDLYSETAMPMDWHPELKVLCESLGMEYFASVFSPQDADYMESLGVCAYKIASFELNDLPLIRHVSKKGKPVILSTGMGEWGEIYEACIAAWEGAQNVIIMKCTSAYPADIGEANLWVLLDGLAGGPFATVTNADWGLSDHTLSIIPPIVAVSLGAVMIEKHLTLSRADSGPDASFSLEPDEFSYMVQAVRDTEKALGEVRYGPTEAEKPMLRFRRSLFAVQDIQEGEEITHDNVKSIRPGDGLPPDSNVWGKRTKRRIGKGEPMSWELLE